VASKGLKGQNYDLSGLPTSFVSFMLLALKYSKKRLSVKRHSDAEPTYPYAIKQLPGYLIFTGNHFYRTLVNDCIANAKKTC
jgi:hypothetical protein